VGSLTVPPCTEGVRRLVLKDPVDTSAAQLAAFRKLHPMNARPVQALNDRRLEESR
jgi:carbonic anhydrase